jgi:hypothetical protein
MKKAVLCCPGCKSVLVNQQMTMKAGGPREWVWWCRKCQEVVEYDRMAFYNQQ